MDKAGRDESDTSQPSPGMSSAYFAADNQQTSRTNAARESAAPHERLFELRSTLTIETLQSDCERLRPSAMAHLPSGRTVSGHIRWHADSGLSFESERRIVAGSCQVRFLLHGVVFRVDARLDRAEARQRKNIQLREPRWYTFDRRTATRLSLQEGTAKLDWASPFRAGELTSSEVSDLSPFGMQIRLDREDKLPEHECFPAALCIGGSRIPCVAEKRQVAGHTGELRGLRLRTDPEDDALASAYLAQRFPRLRARNEIAADEIRSMLKRSGYLGLRDCGDVSAEWCGLSLPHRTSWDFVYQASDGVAIGMASATRVYTHTWLLHQLATLGGHPETVACRKALYGFACAVPNIYSGDQTFGLAYFDINKRWHRLFFEEFTYWIDDPSEAVIVKLDRFERDTTADLPAPTSVDGYTVARATDAELLLATAIARSQLPRVTADALNLAPWSLRAEALCGPQHQRHYQRAREVFVLRGPEGIEAVALCETGERRVSLFGILDMAHVFVPSAHAATPLAAQLLLLAEIRAFYAARGVHDPLVVAPHGTLRADEEPGTRLVETMGSMAMSSYAMRQWENFCEFHFGHQLSSVD